MATMGRIPAGAIEASTDDLPALARAFSVGVDRGYLLPSRGVRRDELEEIADRFGLSQSDDETFGVDDGPELPDVGEDGFSREYDEFERWNSRMSLFLAGRGPHPDAV